MPKNKPPVKAWEKQEKETPTSYRWFCEYRDMGPDRSIEKVQAIRRKTTGKDGVRTLYEWSTKFKWPERAVAYDLHIEKISRERRESELVRMNDRHLNFAYLMQNKIVEALNNIDFRTIRPQDVPKWMDMAVQLERQIKDETRSEKAALEIEKLRAEVEKLKAEIMMKSHGGDGEGKTTVNIYMPKKEAYE